MLPFGRLDAERHPVLHEAERAAGACQVFAEGQFWCWIQSGLHVMAGEELPAGFTENLQGVSAFGADIMGVS